MSVYLIDHTVTEGNPKPDWASALETLELNPVVLEFRNPADGDFKPGKAYFLHARTEEQRTAWNQAIREANESECALIHVTGGGNPEQLPDIPADLPQDLILLRLEMLPNQFVTEVTTDRQGDAAQLVEWLKDLNARYHEEEL